MFVQAVFVFVVVVAGVANIVGHFEYLVEKDPNSVTVAVVDIDGEIAVT